MAHNVNENVWNKFNDDFFGFLSLKKIFCGIISYYLHYYIAESNLYVSKLQFSFHYFRLFWWHENVNKTTNQNITNMETSSKQANKKKEFELLLLIILILLQNNVNSKKCHTFFIHTDNAQLLVSMTIYTDMQTHAPRLCMRV